MNRWHIYEWLKQSYMFSGKVPTRDETYLKFGGKAPREEIEEGIAEFEIVVKKKLPHVERRRGTA